MSAAPALLRWIRSRQPGVSRRQRSSSAGAEGREGEGEVRAVMLGKVAGWATGLKSPPSAASAPRARARGQCMHLLKEARLTPGASPGITTRLEQIAHH